MKGKGKSKGTVKVKVEIDEDLITNHGEFSGAISVRENACISDFQGKTIKDVNLEDLSATQFKLEKILISATNKRKQLEKTFSTLETPSVKKNKRTRSTDSTEKKTLEERHPKKIKESSNKAFSVSTSSQPRGKFIQATYIDPHQDIPKVQKNDGPSRFWTFLEPYCTEITQDTVRAIEEWITPQEDDKNYKIIPELGEHFASKWPMEDIKEEIKEGSKSVENNKGLFTDSEKDQAEGERMLQLGETDCTSQDPGEYPSLIDRIVYSLVGENLMTSLDDTMNEASNDDNFLNVRPSATTTPNLDSNDTLEKRLIKMFLEEGLLKSESPKVASPNDDICNELKALQNALLPVQEYNTLQKKKLLALAKSEMNRQEVKKKLHEQDAKVMEIYRIMTSAKKTGTMNKKLEDQVKRTLRERRKLVEKLNNLI